MSVDVYTIGRSTSQEGGGWLNTLAGLLAAWATYRQGRGALQARKDFEERLRDWLQRPRQPAPEQPAPEQPAPEKGRSLADVTRSLAQAWVAGGGGEEGPPAAAGPSILAQLAAGAGQPPVPGGGPGPPLAAPVAVAASSWFGPGGGAGVPEAQWSGTPLGLPKLPGEQPAPHLLPLLPGEQPAPHRLPLLPGEQPAPHLLPLLPGEQPAVGPTPEEQAAAVLRGAQPPAESAGAGADTLERFIGAARKMMEESGLYIPPELAASYFRYTAAGWPRIPAFEGLLQEAAQAGLNVGPLASAMRTEQQGIRDQLNAVTRHLQAAQRNHAEAQREADRLAIQESRLLALTPGQPNALTANQMLTLADRIARGEETDYMAALRTAHERWRGLESSALTALQLATTPEAQAALEELRRVATHNADQLERLMMAGPSVSREQVAAELRAMAEAQQSREAETKKQLEEARSLLRARREDLQRWAQQAYDEWLAATAEYYRLTGLTPPASISSAGVLGAGGLGTIEAPPGAGPVGPQPAPSPGGGAATGEPAPSPGEQAGGAPVPADTSALVPAALLLAADPQTKRPLAPPGTVVVQPVSGYDGDGKNPATGLHEVYARTAEGRKVVSQFPTVDQDGRPVLAFGIAKWGDRVYLVFGRPEAQQRVLDAVRAITQVPAGAGPAAVEENLSRVGEVYFYDRPAFAERGWQAVHSWLIPARSREQSRQQGGGLPPLTPGSSPLGWGGGQGQGLNLKDIRPTTGLGGARGQPGNVSEQNRLNWQTAVNNLNALQGHLTVVQDGVSQQKQWFHYLSDRERTLLTILGADVRKAVETGRISEKTVRSAYERALSEYKQYKRAYQTVAALAQKYGLEKPQMLYPNPPVDPLRARGAAPPAKQKASGQKPSVQKPSVQKPSGQKPSGQKPSGKQASRGNRPRSAKDAAKEAGFVR